MVSTQEILNAHAVVVSDGGTVQDLADLLNMKVQSLTQRLTTIRKGLKDKGATDEEILAALPSLTRRSGGGRRSTNQEIFENLLTKVREEKPEKVVA